MASGDTLYSIANQFSSRISRILYANPNLEANTIYPGQRIIIPFGYIVPTNISYTSKIMHSNITALKRIYPFLQIESIGKSVLGKNLTAIRIGRGAKQVFYNGSFHANEWITTPLLMKFIENFCISYVTNSEIYGYNPHNIFDTVSIYIVPMVNPDGVDLVTGAIRQNSTAYKQAQQIANTYPSIPFPSRLESKYHRCGFKFTVPSTVGNKQEKLNMLKVLHLLRLEILLVQLLYQLQNHYLFIILLFLTILD